MMNKTEATQTLNLDSTATADQVHARYKQIRAFFTVHVDVGKNLIGLAALSMSRFHEAYEALPDTSNGQSTDEKTTANADKVLNEQLSSCAPAATEKTCAGSFTSTAKSIVGSETKSEPPISADTGHYTGLKAFVFPHPLHTAGDLFSDQWWKVCKRSILLALAAMSILFSVLPAVLSSPAPPVAVGPYQPPDPVPANPPIRTTSPYGPTSPFPQ